MFIVLTLLPVAIAAIWLQLKGGGHSGSNPYHCLPLLFLWRITAQIGEHSPLDPARLQWREQLVVPLECSWADSECELAFRFFSNPQYSHLPFSYIQCQGAADLSMKRQSRKGVMGYACALSTTETTFLCLSSCKTDAQPTMGYKKAWSSCPASTTLKP